MRVRSFLVALSLVAAAPLAWAAPSADEIVRTSTDRRTVQSSIQTISMEIYDKTGKSRIRKLQTKFKQGADGGTMSIVRFIEPLDVAGTAFLSVQKKGAVPEGAMYMPAFGDPQAIEGDKRGGAFMQSDFSYEDLSVGRPEDATHTWVRSEAVTVGGQSFQAHLIESVPKAEAKSAYSKLQTWIDEKDLVPRQILFFDTKGEAVKRMSIEQVRKEGAAWVPAVTVMESLKKGSKTVIRLEQVRVNVPATELPDAAFTRDALKTGA